MLNEQQQFVNNVTKENETESSVQFPWSIYDNNKKEESVENNINESIKNTEVQSETFWF